MMATPWFYALCIYAACLYGVYTRQTTAAPKHVHKDREVRQMVNNYLCAFGLVTKYHYNIKCEVPTISSVYEDEFKQNFPSVYYPVVRITLVCTDPDERNILHTEEIKNIFPMRYLKHLYLSIKNCTRGKALNIRYCSINDVSCPVFQYKLSYLFILDLSINFLS